MFPHAIFISYILMLFLGLQGVSLIILVKLSGNKSDKLFKTNRNFILVSLFLGVLYFITYYNDLVIGEFKTSLIYRLFDGMIFYALGFSWIKVVDGFVPFENEKMAALRKYTNIAFIFLMLVSSFSYGVFLDGLYNTTGIYTNAIIIFLELVLVFTVLTFTILYMKRALHQTLDKLSKRYLVVVSILVNISVIWNSLVALSIFVDVMQVSVLSMYSYGLTAIFMLLMNAYVLVYIYKSNMDAIYGRKTEIVSKDSFELSEEKNIEERMKNIHITYKLTEREMEILKLAYTGLTNPEMGEVLCISKHTAKRHMHNIFEKLHVTTRMGLVHFINGKV